MDLFVMPSVSEGMSNAILEAMATGLPVLATDCGANREVIIDGKTGNLFPCDDEERLSELILNLLQDTGKRLRMGKEARKRILERFTVRRMVEEMERVYVEELTCEKK
jgi:glycosyltransferase involved in cell wall biosynthesis